LFLIVDGSSKESRSKPQKSIFVATAEVRLRGWSLIRGDDEGLSRSSSVNGFQLLLAAKPKV
jgi:hypothetical protein